MNNYEISIKTETCVNNDTFYNIFKNICVCNNDENSDVCDCAKYLQQEESLQNNVTSYIVYEYRCVCV